MTSAPTGEPRRVPPAPHGAEGPADSPPPPWHRATLVTPCPRCGVDAGERCVDERRGRLIVRNPRRPFHFERYALARELAGEALTPSVPS
jgi:hypothetical protein